MTLYDYPDSGKSDKPQFLFLNLDMGYNLIQLDIINGERQTEKFKNKPSKENSVLIVEDNSSLWVSNAILSYFTEGTDY